MPAYIALLRGINVGGRGILPMAELRAAFEAAGSGNVRTFIQSGNVLFTARKGGLPALDRKVRTRLKRTLGDDPVVIYRSRDEMAAILSRVAAGALARDPRIKLYLTFLARAPRVRPAYPIESEKEGLEVRRLGPRDLFVISRRLKSGRYGFPNTFVEKELGVPATSRNVKTVGKILDRSS